MVHKCAVPTCPQTASGVHQIRDQDFHLTCTASGSTVRGPRVDGIIWTVISVLMTSLLAEIGKFSHRSRASDTATSVTSGEVNRGSARRSAALISGSSRAYIRDGACGVTSPAVGVLRVPSEGDAVEVDVRPGSLPVDADGLGVEGPSALPRAVKRDCHEGVHDRAASTEA